MAAFFRMRNIHTIHASLFMNQVYYACCILLHLSPLDRVIQEKFYDYDYDVSTDGYVTVKFQSSVTVCRSMTLLRFLEGRF